MKKCSKCGKILGDRFYMCPKCGAPFPDMMQKLLQPRPLLVTVRKVKKTR